jgi:hypothetical protein
LSQEFHAIEHLFGALGGGVQSSLQAFLLPLELRDASCQVDAMQAALVFFDLFDARFSDQRSPTEVRELGREIPDERVELGEGALFSWFVV